MNIHDGGEYSCEIEADQPEPISVVHTVEILGKQCSDFSCYDDTDVTAYSDILATVTVLPEPISVVHTVEILGKQYSYCQLF